MDIKKILVGVFTLLICYQTLAVTQTKEIFDFVISANATAYSGDCGENATWVFNETTNTLTISGTGNMDFNGDVMFNPWYDGTIDISNSITLADKIKHIVIEEGITSICAEAFFGFANVIDISIPNTVTFIGSNAFNKCASIKEIVIPNNETFLDNYVFYQCSSLEKINLPSSMEKINDGLFAYCTSLKTVELPDNVSSIGEGTFMHCTSLETIELPNDLTTIEEQTFMSCDSLKNIIIPNTVTSIKSKAFWGCSQLDNVIIPNSVTSINCYAFCYCENLYSITIPSSVTEIGLSAYGDTYGLFDYGKNPNMVIYCESGSAIESYAIKYDIKYKDISELSNNTDEYNNICGENVTYSFDESTGTLTLSGSGYMWKFSDTTLPYWNNYKDKIVNVIIQNGITNISNSCFLDCINLISIEIPDSVTNIENHTFENCTKLNDINIPSNVISIGSYAFKNCSALKNIIIPDSVTNIENHTFENCTELNDINIPSSVISIGSYAFKNCSALKNIIIPDSVTVINEATFEDCTSLESFNIGNNIVSINHGAFYNCISMKNITIPSTVIDIDFFAFGYYKQNIDEYSSTSVKFDDFKIYGYKNSSAETYALNNNISFISISNTQDDTNDKPTITDILKLKKYILGISQNSSDLDFNNDNSINILDLSTAKHILFK